MVLERLPLVVAALAAACAAPEPAPEAPVTYHELEAHVGGHNANGTGFGAASGEPVAGGTYLYRVNGGALAIEGSWFRSVDEGQFLQEFLGVEDVFRFEFDEYSLGARYTLGSDASRVHPYVGAGLVGTDIEAKLQSFGFPDTNEWAGGVYAHAGLWFDLGDRWRIGVDLRGTRHEEFELIGAPFELETTQVTVFVGAGF